MTDQDYIRQLIQSNDQLRAALIIAGKELSKRQIVGRRHSTMLEIFRNTIRDACVVVKTAKSRLKEKSRSIAVLDAHDLMPRKASD